MKRETPLGADDVVRDEARVLRPPSSGESSPPLSALCISGGGIRSATFALGALQGLAARGLLEQFDYLSTVSGGGYIGSWLTAWVSRSGGIPQVARRLRPDAPPPGPGEPDPVQHLREYNSYLSPRIGAFSADLWTVIATVARNIFLNWMILVPLLAFVLMLPRLYLSILAFPAQLFRTVIFVGTEARWGAPELDVISRSPLVTVVIPVLSGVLFAVALFNTLRFLPGIGGRDHSRYDYVLGILLPLVGAVLTFLMFDSLYYLGSQFEDYSNLGSVVLWTTVPFAAAWLAYLPVHRGPARARLRLLFGPLSLAVAVMAAGTGVATWVTTNIVLWNPDPQAAPSWADYVTLGPPLILLGFALASFLFTGLSSSTLADEDREWMSRAVAGFLLFGVAWAGVCFVVLMAPHWALGWRAWGHGALAAAGALSAWLSTSGGSFAANANPAAAPQARAAGLSVATRLAPPLFIGLLGGLLSVLTNVVLQGVHALGGRTMIDRHGQVVGWDSHYGILTSAHPALVALVAVGFLALSVVMAHFVNINTFSLHGMYRDRLVRAYLGASNPERQASRFTGFSRTDDIPMHALDPRRRPFHVVNLTLNLVSTSRLAWQQRMATSFTVTPLHAGSAELGYRPSARYGGGISLGTAVAISGAAASPSMGYHSSPVVGFIMTLFNARLGSWLGNPGPPGERTWTESSPRSAIRSLVKEALGLTSDRSAYVYLSDGGHFENLGLYEMVRRRCRLVVVLDSGCDPDFSYDDLGNALRKVRIDLGIPIVFDDADMRPLRERRARCAVATIRYGAVDGTGEDGRLLYVKPLLRGNEPPDVLSYAAAHPTFPHQTTADQWFDESQTESYRQLGLFTVEEICAGWPGGSLADLWPHVRAAYLGEGAKGAQARSV